MAQSKTAEELKPLFSDDDEVPDNFRNIKLNRKDEFGVYLPSQIDDQIRYDLSKRAIVIVLVAFLICIVFLMAFLAIPILVSPAIQGHHDTPHTGNETQVVEDTTPGHSTEQHTRRSTVDNIVLGSTKNGVPSHNDLTHTPHAPSSVSSSQKNTTVTHTTSLSTQTRSTIQSATTTTMLTRLTSSTTRVSSTHAPSSTVTYTTLSTTTYTPSSSVKYMTSQTAIPSTHASSSSTRFGSRGSPSSTTTTSTAFIVTRPMSPTTPTPITTTYRWTFAPRPRSSRGSSKLGFSTSSTSPVKDSSYVTPSPTAYTGDMDQGSGYTEDLYKRETGSIS